MTSAIEDVPHDRLAAVFVLPDARLRRYVSGYHVYSAGPPGSPPHDEWFFPAWANVRFRHDGGPWRVGRGAATPAPVPGAALFGPSSAGAHSVSQGGIVSGFGVTPIGWARLFGAPAHAFADRIVPLGELWEGVEPLHAALLRARSSAQVAAIFDAALLARLRPAARDEALVAALFDLLVADHGIDVDAAAARLGCSAVKLRRIARDHFGFAPKLLLRRSRFVKSLVAIFGREAGEWGRLIDPSYFDQSHFIHEAHEFLGMAPGAFLALDRPLTRLSMAARAKVLGAPAQALHRIEQKSER